MHSPSDTTTDGNSLQRDIDRNQSNTGAPVIAEENYRTLQWFKFVGQMKHFYLFENILSESACTANADSNEMKNNGNQFEMET